MKPSLTLAFFCFLLSSCVHRPVVIPPSEADSLEREREREAYVRAGHEYVREAHERFVTPPRIGMREEVSAVYGRPTSVNINARSEVWTYSFNATDVRPGSPFRDTSTNVKCSVTFSGLTGRVVQFNWQAMNPVLNGGTGGGYGGGYGGYRTAF